MPGLLRGPGSPRPHRLVPVCFPEGCAREGSQVDGGRNECDRLITLPSGGFCLQLSEAGRVLITLGTNDRLVVPALWAMDLTPKPEKAAFFCFGSLP